MRSLANLVVLLLFVQCLHATKNAKVKDLVGDLAGAYALKEFNGGHPSLASVVKTGDTMGLIAVDLFPIETCQAVKICIGGKDIALQQVPYKVMVDECADSIEYHPPTGKVIIKHKDGSADTTGYATKLAFERSATSYQIDLSKDPYYRKATYAIDKPAVVDLSEKTLLILTNSRQCHAQVSFSGRSSFEDLMTPENIEGQFPEKFEYAKSGEKVSTFFTDTSYPGGKRTFDSLAFIKTFTTAVAQFGQLKFKCSTSGTGQTNREKITKHSVLIGHVVKNQVAVGATGSKTKMIAINTIECHYVRLYFTANGRGWNDYPANIGNEIHQTIDFFFHEGFVFLPDRENAIRLPGSSRQIQSVSITYHDKGLAEISFGRVGNDYLNPISFMLPILGQTDFNVFMIRSPNCDARFSQGTPKITGHHKPNLYLLKECKALMITPPAA